MSICDALSNWDNLSPEERFEQMKEWTQEFAGEWGIDPPDVVNSDPPWGNAGGGPVGYDHETNTVYLGPDLFSDNSDFSPEDVTGEAAHETRHAMQWQYYGEDTKYTGGLEDDAQAFGDAVGDFARDECDPGPDSEPEDPGGDDGGEWVLDDGEDEEGGEEPGRSPRPKPGTPEEEDNG